MLLTSAVPSSVSYLTLISWLLGFDTVTVKSNDFCPASPSVSEMSPMDRVGVGSSSVIEPVAVAWRRETEAEGEGFDRRTWKDSVSSKRSSPLTWKVVERIVEKREED